MTNLLLVADPHNTIDNDNTWSQATIACGSAVNFYANPDTIYFVVTLTSFGSICKPVNSRDWVRKLEKQKGDISHMDIELDFDGGKYFAMLRLSRGPKGTLEVLLAKKKLYMIFKLRLVVLLCLFSR